MVNLEKIDLISTENKTKVDSSEHQKQHWNKTYLSKPANELGWFEDDFSPSLRLLDKCKLNPEEACILIGSGNSQFPDHLLRTGLKSIWLTDISEIAIQEVKERIGDKLKYQVGDILQSDTLRGIPKVQLWFDRAVLHFFTSPADQETYFKALKGKVKPGGYVILAEFNLSGAEKCSGLPVFRYDEKMFQIRLGEGFKLLDSFEHTHITPSGGLRPYIYALYQRMES